MEILNFKGQTLIELVVGLGLIVIVISALAITTGYGLRNSQFSKNQVQASNLAEDNLEKVRTIRSANLGLCLLNDSINGCHNWESIWSTTLGIQSTGCTSCKFVVITNCYASANPSQLLPLCLREARDPDISVSGFSSQIFIEDEAGGSNPQKKITSATSWTDTTGPHTAKLITIFSRI